MLSGGKAKDRICYEKYLQQSHVCLLLPEREGYEFLLLSNVIAAESKLCSLLNMFHSTIANKVS